MGWHLYLVKMVKNGQGWSKPIQTVKNCPKWSNMVKYGFIWFIRGRILWTLSEAPSPFFQNLLRTNKHIHLLIYKKGKWRLVLANTFKYGAVNSSSSAKAGILMKFVRQNIVLQKAASIGTPVWLSKAFRNLKINKMVFSWINKKEKRSDTYKTFPNRSCITLVPWSYFYS